MDVAGKRRIGGEFTHRLARAERVSCMILAASWDTMRIA